MHKFMHTSLLLPFMHIYNLSRGKQCDYEKKNHYDGIKQGKFEKNAIVSSI